MNKLPISTFKHTIQDTHGVWSQLISRERVVETFKGEIVWEGEVLVFELLDHPTALRCYAWESEGWVTAVLHAGPVDSPVKAVRASILSEAPDL